MSEKIYSYSPDQEPQDGFQALVNATIQNDEGEVEQLLLYVNPNAGYTEQLLTLLHLAVLQNSPGIVFRLLQAGANPNAQDQAGNTPLEYATYLRQNPMIHMLTYYVHPQAQRSMVETPGDEHIQSPFRF